VIPKGNAEWIKERAGKILQELSKDAKSLFDYLDNNKYMNLITNKSKASGAYTTFLSSPRIPYIFANLNGTHSYIRILMHEFGHAFQMYKGIRNDMPEYLAPTKEAAEIHSMTMEYLTLPWMDIIFGEDADKCRFAFLEEAILAMPRRACVDEFQHSVYLNPNMTIEERKKGWRQLEKKYFPFDDIFSGYISLIKVHKVKQKLTVDYEQSELCLLDDGYKCLMFLPDNEKWCVSAVYNTSGEIVEWYFDMTKVNSIDDKGNPFYDDLYLDIAVSPDFKIVILDEDELKEALESKIITKTFGEKEINYDMHKEENS